jgi:hypothetical protein
MPCKMVELWGWDPSITRHACFPHSCKVHNLTLPWIPIPRIMSCHPGKQ